MLRKESEAEFVFAENVAGGEGTIKKQMLLNSAEMFEKGRMVAKVTLKPNCGIGEHPHVKDAEIYYILSGEVIVTDNDKTEVLHAGDILFTGNGNSHSIKNKSSQDAEFLAVIIN